jgi:hypothetical protein
VAKPHGRTAVHTDKEKRLAWEALAEFPHCFFSCFRHHIASAFRLNGDDVVCFFGQKEWLDFFEPFQSLALKRCPINGQMQILSLFLAIWHLSSPPLFPLEPNLMGVPIQNQPIAFYLRNRWHSH